MSRTLLSHDSMEDVEVGDTIRWDEDPSNDRIEPNEGTVTATPPWVDERENIRADCIRVEEQTPEHPRASGFVWKLSFKDGDADE